MTSRNIKVLLFTTSSSLSGTEKMIFELATRIDKTQFDVLVCTLKKESSDTIFEVLRDHGIRTISFGIKTKLNFYRIFLLFFVLHTYKPDILHSFLDFDNLVGRVVGKLMGVPIIISGQRSANPHRSSFRNFFDSLTTSLADYFMSNSEAGKKILLEKYKIPVWKVSVIPNGVDSSLFEQCDKKFTRTRILDKAGLGSRGSSAFLVGFVGRFVPAKGLDVLLEIAQMVVKQSPSVYFFLIGRGPLEKNLKERSRTLGLEQYFFWIGQQSNISEWMSGFDVLTLPSLWEGFPNVVLEAMAARIPVIAASVGDTPRIIEEGKSGFLVSAGDAAAFAERILFLSSLPYEQRKIMGEYGYQKVKENFSIESMVRAYESYYKSWFHRRLG